MAALKEEEEGGLPPLMELFPRKTTPQVAASMSKQAFELCWEKDAPGLRAFLHTHCADIDLYLHEKKIVWKCREMSLNIMGSAAMHDSTECLQVLLDFNVDVNYKSEAQFSTWTTPLLRAASTGSVECMRLLLAVNADVRDRNLQGDSVLVVAVENGELECMRVLIDANADVSMVNYDGYNGLHMACQAGNAECIRILIDNNADVNCKGERDDGTVITYAATGGHTECVKMLIEANADVNLCGEYGLNALHWSVYKGVSTACACLSTARPFWAARRMRGVGQN
jgi:hypothetical protein